MKIRNPLWLTPALLLVLAGCGSSSSTKAASTPAAPTIAAATTAAPDADASSPDADASSPDADASSPDADASSPDADASDADADADSDADPADATKACDDDATKADPDAAVPSDVPTVDGYTPLSKVTAGMTTKYKGAVTGGPDDLPTVRDAGIKKLQAAGYTEGDHDQEEGAEADGDFTGKHNGNINVRNLCKGELVVTYTING